MLSSVLPISSVLSMIRIFEIYYEFNRLMFCTVDHAGLSGLRFYQLYYVYFYFIVTDVSAVNNIFVLHR